MGNIIYKLLESISGITLNGVANGIVDFITGSILFSFIWVVAFSERKEKSKQARLKADMSVAKTRVFVNLVAAGGLIWIAQGMAFAGITTKSAAMNLCSVLFSVMIYYEGLQNIKMHRRLRHKYNALVKEEGKESGGFRKAIRFLIIQGRLLLKNRVLLGNRLNGYLCYFDRGRRVEVNMTLFGSLVRTCLFKNGKSDFVRQLIKLEQCPPQKLMGRALYIRTHDALREKLKKSKKVKVLEEKKIGRRLFILEFLAVRKFKEAFKLRDKYVIIFMIIE